jgi:hypothetical protein
MKTTKKSATKFQQLHGYTLGSIITFDTTDTKHSLLVVQIGFADTEYTATGYALDSGSLIYLSSVDGEFRFVSHAVGEEAEKFALLWASEFNNSPFKFKAGDDVYIVSGENGEARTAATVMEMLPSPTLSSNAVPHALVSPTDRESVVVIPVSRLVSVKALKRELKATRAVQEATEETLKALADLDLSVTGFTLLAPNAVDTTYAGLWKIHGVSENGNAVVVHPRGATTPMHTVLVDSLIAPTEAQFTVRGTRWSAKGVLAARFGFNLGDEVFVPNTNIPTTIESVLFSSIVPDSIGGVHVTLKAGFEKGAELFDPATLNLVNPDVQCEDFAVGALVAHSKLGRGQVINRVSDIQVQVQFLSGEKETIHSATLTAVPGQKLQFRDLGLLQAFTVGEHTFVKVGGSTGIACTVGGALNHPFAQLARVPNELGKNAKRSFKQSDKVGLYSGS